MSKKAELVKNRQVPRITEEEYLAKMLERGLDEHGRLIPDPVPIAPPVGYRKQPSMVEIVRDMVRGEKMRQAALESGHETFEESEDFDVGEDGEDLMSGYENDFDPPLSEIAREVEAERARSQPAKAVDASVDASSSGGAGGQSPPAESPPAAPEGPPR